MGVKVFTGNEAKQIIPEIMDDLAKVITPVKDDNVTGVKLGHLIIFKGSSVDTRAGKYYSRALTPNQISTGILGSFVFLGTNSSVFNHLFKNSFTGKFTINNVLIDRDYEGLISYEFVHLIHKYISLYKS